MKFLLIQGDSNGPWAEGFIPANGDWPAGGSQAMIVGAPEPATWAMMALGFGGLAAAGRRVRRPQSLTA